MTQLSDFWTSTFGQQTLENIRLRSSQYWSENIYRYYSVNTGKLGQSLEVSLDGNVLVVSLKPIYSIQRDGTIHEYGQDIMDGIPPGTGKYSPIKGYRLKYGQYPGVSVNKFWRPWLAEFEPAFQDIVREEVSNGVRDFIREQLIRGA